MKKTRKFISVVLTLLILCLSVTGCSQSNDPKDLLVGEWESVTWQLYIIGPKSMSTIEFFSDGTYTSNAADCHGRYTIDNNRIKLEATYGEPLVCSFSTDGKTIIFTIDNDEHEYKYTKK